MPLIPEQQTDGGMGLQNCQVPEGQDESPQRAMDRSNMP